MILAVVVLPEPDSPTIASARPFSNGNDTSSTATTSLRRRCPGSRTRKTLRRCSASRTGGSRIRRPRGCLRQLTAELFGSVTPHSSAVQLADLRQLDAAPFLDEGAT